MVFRMKRKGNIWVVQLQLLFISYFFVWIYFLEWMHKQIHSKWKGYILYNHLYNYSIFGLSQMPVWHNSDTETPRIWYPDLQQSRFMFMAKDSKSEKRSWTCPKELCLLTVYWLLIYSIWSQNWMYRSAWQFSFFACS